MNGSAAILATGRLEADAPSVGLGLIRLKIARGDIADNIWLLGQLLAVHDVSPPATAARVSDKLCTLEELAQQTSR